MDVREKGDLPRQRVSNAISAAPYMVFYYPNSQLLPLFQLSSSPIYFSMFKLSTSYKLTRTNLCSPLFFFFIILTFASPSLIICPPLLHPSPSYIRTQLSYRLPLFPCIPSPQPTSMAFESWLAKVKSAISIGLDTARSTMSSDAVPIIGRRKTHVGILAFEVASLMSKLLHLWRSLSDAHVTRLRHESIAMYGVRKVVSDDDAFLLGLACAELADALHSTAESVSAIALRCTDLALRNFYEGFMEFADTGSDPHRWVMSWKEMESKAKRMDRYVATTASLYKEMEELAEAEHGLRKLMAGGKIAAAAEAQQKVFWRRQEVKQVKQASLWVCNYDVAVLLLVRASFTVLARLIHVFGLGHAPRPLPRSLSVSSAVYPSSDTPPPQPKFASDQLTLPLPRSPREEGKRCGLFELSSEILVPPPTTLGAAALALHYANVIAAVEKMIRAPRSVGPDARDDLYAMLPASVRAQLRARLRGVGEAVAREVGLAREWRSALGRIVDWLGPVAHNTIRWQGERSFEQRRSAAAARGNVLLLQTLFFANREKVEAAITELLVGLNYVWRFEMQMSAKALMQLHCSPNACLDS